MWHGGLRSGVAEKMAPIRGFPPRLRGAKRSSPAAFRFAPYGPLAASDERAAREALRRSLSSASSPPLVGGFTAVKSGNDGATWRLVDWVGPPKTRDST
jgi:hypothetical protein